MNLLEHFTRLLRWPSNATNVYRVSFWILLAIIGGLIAVLVNLSDVIWGLAALASGGLLGFLFGIPRVEQGTTFRGGNLDESDEEMSLKKAYRQTVNTNLTEISDWLTKIIVGVSLVQMTQIPPAFESLVRFLSGSKHDPGFVGGVLVFFGVSGFLSGYLLTRLFLASAFSEADRAANDFNLRSTRLPTQPGPQPTGATLSLITRSPIEAVLTNWVLLLDTAKKAILRREPDAQVPRLANAFRDKLTTLQILNREQAALFDDLRQLRNIAAHSTQAITEEAATDYVNNAKALVQILDSVT